MFRFTSRSIPIGAFTFRTNFWFGINIEGNPLMPTTFTLKSFNLNIYNRHSVLQFNNQNNYILSQYISQEVLTSYYFYGILSLEYILWRYVMEMVIDKPRQERGLVIAATQNIEKNKIGWKVPSQSGNGNYVVNLDHGEPFCT